MGRVLHEVTVDDGRSTRDRRLGRGRHHERHGTRGGLEVDVLVRLTQRGQLGHHLDSGNTRTLERLQQSITTVDQLLDLLAGELASASQLAEHALAVRTRFVDHVAALLLGHLQLGLGIGRCVLTTSRRFDLSFLTQALGLIRGLAQQACGALLCTQADLRGGLTSRLQHARRFLAEEPRGGVLVDERFRPGLRVLECLHLALECALTFLEPGLLSRDHAQEVTHFRLIEASPGDRELGRRHRRR